jgi:hypothetical protein
MLLVLLAVDIKFPTIPSVQSALFQTHPDNADGAEGLMNFSGSVGSLGFFNDYNSFPKIQANTWHTVTYCFNGTSGELRAYIDGVRVSHQNSATFRNTHRWWLKHKL